MALVEVGYASIQFGDSAKKLASASFRVSPADARAYLAAADQAARNATDVGVLLNNTRGITRATATQNYRQEDVGIRWLNDAFEFPGQDEGQYNSNMWKVTGKTTNAGLPTTDTVYVPQYLVAGVEMESNGIAADIDEAPVSDFVTAFLSTALSRFGTAFTEVVSIERNDT